MSRGRAITKRRKPKPAANELAAQLIEATKTASPSVAEWLRKMATAAKDRGASR